MQKCWVPHRPVPHVASAQIVLASSCGLKPAGVDTTGEEANLTITSAWFRVWGMLDCAPILHSCGMKKNKMIYSIINNKDQERDQEWPKAICWFRLLWEKNPLWKNWLLVYLDQKSTKLHHQTFLGWKKKAPDPASQNQAQPWPKDHCWHLGDSTDVPPGLAEMLRMSCVNVCHHFTMPKKQNTSKQSHTQEDRFARPWMRPVGQLLAMSG